MRSGCLIAAMLLAGCENHVTLQLATSGALDAQHVRMTLRQVALKDDAGNVALLDSEVTGTKDLLNFDSGSTMTVLNGAKLGPGHYVGLALTFDANSAEIVDSGGQTWPIAVSGTQVFAPIDFSVGNKDAVSLWANLDLRLSLSDQTASSSADWQFAQRLLAGDLATAASLSGTISAAIHDSSSCLQGRTSPDGAAVYAYPQISGAPYDDSPSASPHPVATVAVAWKSDHSGSYAFAHLPAGSYTVALNCVASADDPQVQDNQQFATAGQDVTLANGDAGILDFQ